MLQRRTARCALIGLSLHVASDTRNAKIANTRNSTACVDTVSNVATSPHPGNALQPAQPLLRVAEMAMTIGSEMVKPRIAPQREELLALRNAKLAPQPQRSSSLLDLHGDKDSCYAAAVNASSVSAHLSGVTRFGAAPSAWFWHAGFCRYTHWSAMLQLAL